MARLTGHSLVCKRALELFLYTIVRLIFRGIQILWWKYNGTEKRIKEAALPRNYDRCVQVLKIIWWNKFDLLMTSSPSEFLCVHDRFESPKYIFDNDHVSLFMLNEKYAIFSEAKEKDMQLWKIKYGCFIRENHVLYSSHLLYVPIEQFHRMAEELGEPKGELTFIFNTSRCGSTLLAQMAEETGELVNISEPNQMNQLATIYKKNENSRHVRQLARDVVRWTCRPYRGLVVSGYFIKLISPAICSISLLREVFPKSHLLFMYRDVVKVSQSMYRAAQEYPTLRLAYTLSRLWAGFMEMSANAMGFYGPDYSIKTHDDITLGVFNWIATAKYYMDLRSLGKEVAAVRYEDLISDPRYSSRQILKYCGLEENLAELFVKGMTVDSQRNSVLSKANLGQHKNPQLSQESKDFHNALLKKKGFDRIGEPGVLEGTITFKND